MNIAQKLMHDCTRQWQKNMVLDAMFPAAAIGMPTFIAATNEDDYIAATQKKDGSVILFIGTDENAILYAFNTMQEAYKKAMQQNCPQYEWNYYYCNQKQLGG